MTRAFWTVAAFGTAMLASGLASAEIMTFKAEMSGASESPAVQTPGAGSVTARYDTNTKALTWTGTAEKLSGPATAAHFHGPAAAGANAGVMVPSSASPISGTATLTDAQAEALTTGRTYFNVHTAAHPGGEIRGQVVKTP